MYLSRLELFGFKSFAQKTEIQFHDGITAIVGPNGCGKSNIVDAIRWVLGEQKAGVLRSDSMQNVIFNGTRNHKPLGMAEVSITIQNNRNVLPIEYSEVVITRRLFRSGESQYLLNNSVCRLKDILDLFMDTGVGPNAYSVIELNMVEKILNGRPEERRQIFEEAAGVTKYKLRRRAAFRKLEATEQDLIRLSDIISEVEKTVNSLRRQVLKARRYKDMSEELRQLELDYSAFHLAKIQKELGPLQENFKHMRRQREEVASQLAGEEAQIEEWQVQLLEVERQLNARRNDLNANSLRVQQKEEEILVSQERVKAAEQARVRARRDIEELQQRKETLDEEKEQLHQNLAEAEQKLKEVEAEFQKAQAALDEVKQRYTAKRQEGQKLEEARLLRLESIGDAQKEHEKLITQVEYIDRQLESFAQETKELQERQNRTEDKIRELEAQKQNLQDALFEIDESRAVIDREIERIRHEIENQRNRVLDMKGQIQARRERAGLLRKFVETYEDYPEGVRHLLLENRLGDDCHGTVGDLISVDDAYRKAIEVALGEAAVALVVQGSEQAVQAIELLKTEGKGAVTFLPLERIRQNGEADQPLLETVKSHPGLVGRAADLVNVSETFRPALQTLLRHVLIARDLNAAMDIASRLSDSRVAVVTLNGEVAYSWGAIRGGDSEEAEASLVGRKAIIESLENEIRNLESELTELQDQLHSNEQRLKELQEKNRALEEDKQKKVRLLQDAEVALGEARVEQQRSEERIETIRQESAALKEQKSELVARLDELRPQFEQFEIQKQEIEADYAAYQQALEALEVELREAEERVQTIHLELATRKAEMRNDQQALERLLKTEREIEETIKRREEEIRNAEEVIETLNERIAELRDLLQDDFAERKELEEVIAEIEREYQQRKEQLEERDKALRKVRAERDEISERVHEMELRISKLQMDEKNLLDHIREAYEIDLKTHPVPDEIDLDKASQRINELKQKLRTMGPVNMLALKDYETEKERLDFLLSQKEDLLKAEENLKETIRVINNTAYERFSSVFSKVRENFIQVFKSFFENGSADLRMDGDDPLEAEIVIEANPKGKKVGSLALLSGGEKALTAISLLFALYLVKPSPFCILDEVDAPLDDANIRRFTGALKKFSDRTQFIVVTHNKLTMSAANQLYGITMEEPGISKVVSVKFEGQTEEAQEKAEGANI